jgi:hypothetical protein
MIQLALLLGKQDMCMATEEDELLLRFLIPVCKLYTAKLAVAHVSEGLECFGGQGYMEDTGIARALRDTQVLPIWEGTTNILSLDVLRVLIKQPKAYEVFVEFVRKAMQLPVAQHEQLQDHVQKVNARLDELTQILINRPEELQLGAREFAFTLANLSIFANLLQLSEKTKNKDELVLLRKFCETREMFPFLVGSNQKRFDMNQIHLEEQNLVFSCD